MRPVQEQPLASMAATAWCMVHPHSMGLGPRLVMVACLSVAGGELAAQSGPASPDTAPRAGSVAPDFTLITLAGDTTHLSALRGHPVLLNFWATWCAPCKDEMRLLVEAHARFKDVGLEVQAVNLTDQESLRDVRRFVEANRLPFPILLDRKGKVRRAYALRGVPTSIFIDRRGLVHDVHTGPLTADTLEFRLKDILTTP